MSIIDDFKFAPYWQEKWDPQTLQAFGSLVHDPTAATFHPLPHFAALFGTVPSCFSPLRNLSWHKVLSSLTEVSKGQIKIFKLFSDVRSSSLDEVALLVEMPQLSSPIIIHLRELHYTTGESLNPDDQQTQDILAEKGIQISAAELQDSYGDFPFPVDTEDTDSLLESLADEPDDDADDEWEEAWEGVDYDDTEEVTAEVVEASVQLTTALLLAQDLRVYYHVLDTDFVTDVLSTLLSSCAVKFRAPTHECDPVICLITFNPVTGLDLRHITMKGWPTAESMDLTLHYGPKMVEFHNTLTARLTSQDCKGIVLFHGVPGSGKTFYIRRLCRDLTAMGRTIVLIPSNMISELQTPQFTTFLLGVAQEHSNLTLVIEDAEAMLIKREDGDREGSSAISTLLNLTDGILNDIFSVQVIATFNTDLANLDSAVLRSGRLVSRRNFGPLDEDTAKALARELEVQDALVDGIQGPTTVAEVYALRNAEEDAILVQQD